MAAENALSKDKLLDERIESTLKSYPSTALGNWLAAGVLYFALRSLDTINRVHLDIWLLLQFLIGVLWIFFYFRYRHRQAQIKSLWMWGIEIPSSFLAGLLWGMGWVCFIDPNQLETAFYLNAFIYGIIMAGVIITPLQITSCVAFLSACMSPVIVYSFFIGNTLFFWMGMSAIVFLAASSFFAVMLNRLYLDLLKQRERNAELLIALDAEKKQVEKADREKTRFLASASHDLRQPLQAMRLFESSLSAILNNQQQQDILGKIRATHSSLAALLEPLLDISKLDAGTVSANVQPVFLDDLFYRLQQRYTDVAAEQQIQLRCITTQHRILIDPILLERILSNLLDNAIKHMNQPGKILFGVRRKKRSLSLEVYDNGVGIKAQEQENIFDAFYQLNNPERNSIKGLGLGLAIVKRLASLLNCELQLRSEVSKGSCFSLQLPDTVIIDDEQDDLMQIKEVQPKSSPTLQTFAENKHILVIEASHDTFS